MSDGKDRLEQKIQVDTMSPLISDLECALLQKEADLKTFASFLLSHFAALRLLLSSAMPMQQKD